MLLSNFINMFCDITESSRPSWCLDDVIIGRPDVTMNYIYDNFDSTHALFHLSKEYWYEVRGGGVEEVGSCGAQKDRVALLFNSSRRKFLTGKH